MKIVIKMSGIFKQKWSFKFVGSNGKTLAIGEKYYNLEDMMDTILLIQCKARGCVIENKYIK